MTQRKGRVTIPTDLDVVPQTLEMLDKWGADAIRDCDGTEFPERLKNTGAKIYATYYTTRKDNKWAKENPDEIQQMYIMTSFHTAVADTLEIHLMDHLYPDMLAVNTRDDIQRWWEVIDRTTVMALAAVVIITAAVRGIAGHFSSSKPSASGTDKETTADASGSSVSGGDKTEQETASSKSSPKDTLKAAELKATQYDYDGAIELLKADTSYSSDSDMQSAVKKYEEAKASCKSWPLEEVTHVFYHILIKDPSKAFDGDYKEADYNQVMTTIDEFNKITQTMYDKGYVMVSIKDMATVNEDGTMSPGEILLPEGKIPFVLSQDDVCYYHYMDGDGFASKLVVDDEGKIRNEYIEDDGSVSVGDYDMVPLIDRFVEEHPDFSYRGAKGIVALTGYNGILGYRTDISYETRPADLDDNKVEWLDAHPDFSLDKEREEAKKVADAMKEDGWLFASHTWGHQNIGQISLEQLQADTQKFKDNVDPLIGGTDIIIFAFGTDLTTQEDYSGDKFEYLKSVGYNYYCNVDSSKYFVQIRDRYFRQGRRNLDGYRMYYNPDLLEDLFNAKDVFDPSRPTPVPPMG